MFSAAQRKPPQASNVFEQGDLIMNSKRLCSRIFLMIFCLSCVRLSQDQLRAQVTATDDAAVRAIAEQFFAAYARKDLDGFIKLWSAKSPGLELRRKVVAERFAGTDKIELKSLAISSVRIDRERTARVLVTVELSALDVKTGRAAEGFGKLNRALHFVKEAEGWRVLREMASGEELAGAIAAAKTDGERASLLAANKDSITIDLRMALHNAGSRQRVLGNITEAIRTYNIESQVAQQVDDKLGIAIATTGIAIAHAELGDYGAAVENFQKGLAIAEELDSKIQIAALLNNLGIVYRRQGNYNLALQYYQRALATQEAIADKAGVAYALNNIGNIYFYQGNYTLAMEYFRKSLAVKEALEDKASYSSSYYNIANVYYAQDDFPKAIEYYREAHALAEEAGSKLELGNTLEGLASANLMQGDYKSASENYKKSLALFESIGHKFGVAEALSNIGFMSIKHGDYQTALQVAERAAVIARDLGSREHVWQARTVAGKAYRALNQPDQARLAFDEAIAAIESIRADVAGGAQEQQGFFEDKVSPYKAMVDLLVSQNRFDEALAYAERSKARALLDVLSSATVKVTKTMTAAEREKERDLDGMLFSLNSQIARESSLPTPNAIRLAGLKASLQQARLDREAFQMSLYSAHPELKVKRGNTDPVTVEDASALLPDANGALLEYVVKDDETFLFVLTREATPAVPGNRSAGSSDSTVRASAKANLKVYTIAIKHKELAERAAAFRKQLAGRDFRFGKAAVELYDLLLRPARAQLGKKNLLVIVPDDVLWQLPFQVLQSAENRYLLEDAAISYAPSLTVLREMVKLERSNNLSRPSSSILAIGNPALGKQTIERINAVHRDEKLDPLPEAEREVRVLGQLYGHEHSEIFVGPDAREDRVKAEARKFGILHLATHGIIDDASPMYSHLVLSQTDRNPNEDGLLEAWEMMNLNLKAELVVLSACETARGRVAPGEGVIGMSWALFVAGCPTAVVSQWKVDSSSTTELMLEFHKRLTRATQGKRGPMNGAASLREAALKLLHMPEYRHPFYWAGFILIGDGF